MFAGNSCSSASHGEVCIMSLLRNRMGGLEALMRRGDSRGKCSSRKGPTTPRMLLFLVSSLNAHTCRRDSSAALQPPVVSAGGRKCRLSPVPWPSAQIPLHTLQPRLSDGLQLGDRFACGVENGQTYWPFCF